jgi:ethanolamine utilization protein EutN
VLLAEVTGLVVVTPKSGELEGVRFAILQPLGADLRRRGASVVAVDTVGAAEGQRVITAAAGSARLASGMRDRPVDLAVVGIVDEITPSAGGRS